MYLPPKLILINIVLYILPHTWKVGGERINEITILTCKQLPWGPAQSTYHGPILWISEGTVCKTCPIYLNFIKSTLDGIGPPVQYCRDDCKPCIESPSVSPGLAQCGSPTKVTCFALTAQAHTEGKTPVGFGFLNATSIFQSGFIKTLFWAL